MSPSPYHFPKPNPNPHPLSFIPQLLTSRPPSLPLSPTHVMLCVHYDLGLPSVEWPEDELIN